MEALVRWSRDDELVSPAEFIPALEDSGLILALGEWILRQACRDATAWPEHVRLAVNLSAVQFRSGNLVACVTEALVDMASGAPSKSETLGFGTEEIVPWRMGAVV